MFNPDNPTVSTVRELSTLASSITPVESLIARLRQHSVEQAKANTELPDYVPVLGSWQSHSQERFDVQAQRKVY